jgi:hypothetical protein
VVRQRGRVVHVDPIKPTVEAPGTDHLKLDYDHLLSIFALNFNLRRYNVVARRVTAADVCGLGPTDAARHVMGWCLTQETRVQGVLDDVASGRVWAGPDGCCSPRHRMPFVS